MSKVVSIKDKRYHGISRFISFESIIILVLLNYPVWFKEPFAWYQVISWVLLAGSLLVAFFGFYLFYHYGKPDDGMEETTVLITSGLYRYIRHPLYAGVWLTLIGTPFALGSWFALIPTILCMGLLLVRIKYEEEMLIKGMEGYKEYRTRVNYKIIPKIL